MPYGTQHSIEPHQGWGDQRNSREGEKRLSAERDRWMEEAEREDCEGGTDGDKKVTAVKKGNGGLGEERRPS